MSKSVNEILYTGFWKILDWVYPPVCAGCGEPGYRLCQSCKDEIRFFSDIEKGGNESFLVTSQTQLLNCTDIRFVAVYEGVIRECIHALKYENNQALGEMFSEWLVDLVRDFQWQIDMVIPVPLSTQRVQQRGYNQSALIAKPVALKLEVIYAPFGLKRIRNTPSQVGLSAQERHTNVEGAFQANPKVVEGKHVLLVDDVSTTGATIGACAAALKVAKSTDVYCLTVAGFPQNIPVTEGALNQV